MRDLKGPIICGVSTGLLAACVSFGDATVSSDLILPADAPVALTHGVCADETSESVLTPNVRVSLKFGDIFASPSIEVPESFADVEVALLLRNEEPLHVAQMESDLKGFSDDDVENLGEPSIDSPF